MNYVRVGGYIPPQPIEDYNDLPNIPVHNQDLTASGFTPVTNTYYKHTGTTTASYTNGVIYYYNGTGYVALDGSAYGLATVAKTGSYNDLLDKPTIPTDYVPNTRKVNNKALSSDITLGASDVGALPTSGGTVTGNLTVGGNLTINGTTTTVDSTTLQVKDKLIEVAHGNTATLTTPAGLVAPKYDGTNSGALVFDSTGTAYVGDVTFKDGNIDVANSGLQPLATRTGLVGGNLVQYDSSALTLKDSGKKISDLALKTDISSLMPKKGGTFTGEVKFGSTENFQGYYIKRMIGSLGAGTAYNNLDSKYKDGTYHRMWRLRFPNGSSFWGKIKITLYGGYSSFNASGVMSKSVTCNFNTSNIYNNVGCYDGLGVNVEQDFRISEAIWNATVSAWEVLIWQKNLNGNNSPTIMLECWTANNTNYINAFNGITAQAVELTQMASYSAQKASPTGGTKTVEWATLPVYENPLGEEIAAVSDLSTKANLSGGNVFQGKQKFENIMLTSEISSVLPHRVFSNSDDMLAYTENPGNTYKYTSQTAIAFIANTDANNRTAIVDGRIDNKKSGTNYELTLPTKTGTLAITSDIPDISGKANLAGGNTFSGVQTINAPTNVSGSEQTTMKVKTSNGGAIIFGKEGANSGTMIRLDQADGTCRLRFRSSKTAGAMVWEQPEQGAKLHVDLGKDGSDKHRVTFPSSAGTLALTSQVNAKYTKPSDGIPKTDLASDVQTSLGKADNALSLDGGTIKKSKTIKMDASANSDGANLKWGTVNSKNPYIGYASDQVDGTFVVGSLLGTNYASGLAIGGGSGNLLWKGTKVATTSDIPTNYVTTDTTQDNISGRKTFTNTIVKKSNTIDLNAKPTSGTQWNYIEFTDKNDDRIGIAGSRFDAGGYAGVYLQARNNQQLWIASSTPDGNGNTVTKTSAPTPPNTDDSTQIANTSWVRENYQATCYAGRDSGETGTMYFKVASYSTVADYDHVTLVAHLQDVDSPVFSTVNVHCSTSTKAHAPNAYIGVIDNFTHDASNNPFNYYKDRLFVVANYTIGTQGVTFELWLKTTNKYQQTIFKVISQSSRKGTSKKRPWTLYNNVTTASGTTDFSETSSDGRLVVNNNYLYGATVGYLQPQTNNNIDLGASGQRWNNAYITNLQNCKIINGGGGNSMIQQDSDTSGADITVGSTGCPLKIQGKNARPTYRQGKNGTYANLALQSDIPIPFDSNDLSTGTYRSTNLPSGCSLVYIEDRQKGLSGYLYKNSGAMEFHELYFVTNFYTTLTDAKTNLTIYKLKINGTQVEKTYKNLFVSANGSVEVGTEYAENGTFYYKVLK